MLVVAGSAIFAGGLIRDLFFAAIGLICFAELVRLIWRGTRNALGRIVGITLGAVYIGYAVWLLMQINSMPVLLLLIGVVIMVDTFAYFFGRSIGGPKIAPRISPSKTWAGLFGGAVGATLAVGLPLALNWPPFAGPDAMPSLLLFAPLLAVVAQAGDFFESWLKRKAAMKDSSNLIPGHGGVFDRIDGLIPVVIVVGSLMVFSL
ncbi:phosphatidate cytidylyltransferase [Erythrobacter sp. GH3-10]|uniref:Phosphatidate cytidylyltransferase n=2 Tax=Aurantiacibacter rhizosphaerae TaxID=2691582 RepID=A0A844XI11_9SPHN|nr:phosphatidate cytidylyltransferase [Aurantiacibacter rhizosphaerae]